VLPIGLLCGTAAIASAGDIVPTPRGCEAGVWRSAARPLIAGGTSIASDVRPVRVWFDGDHPNSGLIAPAVLTAIEQAWDLQVDVLGFAAPILPDASAGPDFDVYLLRYQEWSAYVAADAYTDALPGDGRNSTSAYMVIDRRLPIEAVPSYAAHEFNHVLQFATDFSEPTLPIWEGTATAAQSWTFGDAGRWDYDVPSFQEVPQYPALTADSYRVYAETGLGWTYEYGAALWVQFLDEKLGYGDGRGGVELWDLAANEGLGLEPDVVDAFAGAAGSDLGIAMAHLSLVRFLTGADWDDRGLAAAAAWGDAEAVPAELLDASALPFERAPIAPPMILGQSFLDFDLAGLAPGIDQVVHVSVTSESGANSGIAVLWWTDGGGTGDALAGGAAPLVEVPAEGLARVVVAVTNLGPVGWDGDQDAYVPGDQVVSVALTDPTSVTTPPTGPTGPTDTGAPVDAGDDGVLGGSTACGCGSGLPAGAGMFPIALMVFGRRRSRR